MIQDHPTTSSSTTTSQSTPKRKRRWLVKLLAWPFVPLFFLLDVMLEVMNEADRLQSRIRAKGSRSRSAKAGSWGTNYDSTTPNEKP